MSLSDKIKAENSKAARTRIQAIMLQLDAEDTETLIAALKDDEIPHIAIARALNDEGYPISEAAVRRHREKMV